MGAKRGKQKATARVDDFADADGLFNISNLFEEDIDQAESTNIANWGQKNAHFQALSHSKDGQASSSKKQARIDIDNGVRGNVQNNAIGNGGWGAPSNNGVWAMGSDQDWVDQSAADTVWGAADAGQWNATTGVDWNSPSNEDWTNPRPHQTATVPKVTITSPDASYSRKVFSGHQDHRLLNDLLNHSSEHDNYTLLHRQTQQESAGKKGKKNRQKQQKQQPKQQHSIWPGGDAEEYDLSEETDADNPWFSNVASAWGKASSAMPSKSYALASDGHFNNIVSNAYENHGNEQKFIDSVGEALLRAQRALYSKDRLARNRIYWVFSPDKDERVRSLLAWIQDMAYPLASYGLQYFLRTRERGALISNADYRPWDSPQEPAFDWISYDDSRATMDRTLQESIAFYDPSTQVLVFVFLLSKTENSMAIWRRKLVIPNNLRLTYGREISQAKAGLRKQYPIYLDEIPSSPDDINNSSATPSRSKRHGLIKQRWFKWFT